jgi:hypothetical protein
MPVTVRGHVTNGRLVVDEPTDLPEGTEVDLVSIEREEPWELPPDQKRELEARVASADRGELVDGELVFEKLRARR